MRKIRHAIAYALGMLLTGIFGISALVLSFIGRYIDACKTFVRGAPEAWGKIILFVINGFVRGRKNTLSPNGPFDTFDGFTLIISNHPSFEELADVQGAVGHWGFRPHVVSKVENLDGFIGFIAGRRLQEMKRGIFIAQNGGEASRAHLRREVENVNEVLVYADKHRPTPERIKNDMERFPDAGLTRHCVPRSGGVHSILCAAVENGRRVRVLNLTWKSSNTATSASLEDVTGLFVLRGLRADRVFSETTAQARLIDLWRAKEKDPLNVALP